MRELRLLTAPKDVRGYQAAISANLAGIKVNEIVVDPAKKHPEYQSTFGDQGQLPQLVTPEGAIIGAAAIMRYFATINREVLLYGRDSWEAAQIDQWIEFASSEIEPRAAVLCAAPNSVKGDLQQAKKAALDQVPSRLDVLENILKENTFLVGERLSLADVAVAAGLVPLFERVIPAEVRTRVVPSVFRWYMTCTQQPQFSAVLGDTSARLYNGAAPAEGTLQSSASNIKQATNTQNVSSNANAIALQQRMVPYELGAHAHAAMGSPVLKQPKFLRRRYRVADLLRDAEREQKDASSVTLVGRTVQVSGWAKTMREQGKGALMFVSLNDGSCAGSLQVVVEKDSCVDGFDAVAESGGTGAAFTFEGEVVKSPAKGQLIELKAKTARVLGGVDPKSYPLSKKRHTLEHLRGFQHLRPRTNTIAAITRIRNACAYATHRFFQERGFLYIHTPIITCSDCEGAGEMFGVTTLLPMDATKDVARDKKSNAIDYSKDFFGRQAALTVSGQLQVEAFACSMSDVYTFGPTFRAEKSHTSRHLSEFWMIEPEIAFADLQDDMNLAEDYLRFCTRYVLEHCDEDLEFFEKMFEKGLRERLKNVVESPFARVTYTEAIKILTDPKTLKKAKFAEKPYWGIDLASEHERYLTEKVYKKPMILSDYPKEIKAFYMRMNEDNKTVAAMDVLVPKIGELMGGSQREERLDVLDARMEEVGVSQETLWWYRDLRRFGSVPHAGFGLGFERLIMYVTGVENIRDVIPFPRYPGHAEI